MNMTKDLETVVEDIEFPEETGDKIIDELFRRIYHEHMQKGMTYTVAARSKFFGHYKYMIVAYKRDHIEVLDLDTNEQTRIK